MKSPARITIGLALAGCAAVLIMALRMVPSPSLTASQKGPLVIMPLPTRGPLAANSKPQPLRADEPPLLPPPVVSAAPSPAAPAVFNSVFMGRPPEESMLSSWAARDPEGAGRWLNQNRSHPKFADMVRGYAIQIATVDPAAARQWAAVLNGSGNQFGLGGTLEQHIDAIEAMLKSPEAPQTRQPQRGPHLRCWRITPRSLYGRTRMNHRCSKCGQPNPLSEASSLGGGHLPNKSWSTTSPASSLRSHCRLQQA